MCEEDYLHTNLNIILTLLHANSIKVKISFHIKESDACYFERINHISSEQSTTCELLSDGNTTKLRTSE